MGCPVRASMDVVQVGEALGLPVWLDRYRLRGRLDRAGQPDQAAHRLQGLDRVRPLQDDDDRPRQVPGRDPVPPGQRQPRLRDGDHRGGPGDAGQGPDRLRARHRRERLRRDGAASRPSTRRISRRASGGCSRSARELDGAAALLAASTCSIVEEIGKNISGSGMDTNVIGRPVQPPRAVPGRSQDPLDRRARPHRRRATATPPASATPTSRPGGSPTRSTGSRPRSTPSPPARRTGPRCRPRSRPTARRWRPRSTASASRPPERARVVRIRNTLDARRDRSAPRPCCPRSPSGRTSRSWDRAGRSPSTRPAGSFRCSLIERPPAGSAAPGPL